ncbi:MAG: hypothetical protein M1817_000366 [Caeruleum heppii]|nr:MAG: hypothetical protein M1817_000366 [Caeruleum heppii]
MSSSKKQADATAQVPKNVADVVLAQAAAAAANDSEIVTADDIVNPDPSGDIDVPGTKIEPSTVETTPITTPFGGDLGRFEIDQDGFNTRAKVSDDGRLNINIRQSSRRLSNLLVPALRSQLDLHTRPEEPTSTKSDELADGEPGKPPPPPLNIVIHVVGSRGDVQPFVALGKVLKTKYGHRVRLATHVTFKKFVEEHGLEFFSIGGDPAELMAFMVKNPGLMPGLDALKSGDVGKRRKGMAEIILGCWRSCIEAGDGTGIQPSNDHVEEYASVSDQASSSGNPTVRPFVADAIIANPPSFAHVHCAEKMGIPLHLMFTMPWSPTQAFPHPLANIQSSNAETSVANFISYALVEMMTWQGLGDVINRFREKSLGLEPVSLMWAPGMITRLRIPYTYCWSPALIPKPRDWGPHISVSGFYMLSLAADYTPAPDLAAFLAAGPPPLYIGFGSIVVDDPNAMTKLIFEAVQKAGVRALVSKGWGGFGADELGIPAGVFMLGNVPHDWLFKHVSCVVHHGGAGTTSTGIALGRPTVIVPFFGDQPFWGAMVARAGAGPNPIPNKELTSDALADAITHALKPEVLDKAAELGAKMRDEKGADVGAATFHENLNLESMRCSLAPQRTAVWRIKRTNIRLSALAATVLGNEGLLDFADVKLHRPREYDTEDGPWEPISGGASALLGTVGSLMMGVADFPVEIVRALKSKTGETKPASSDTSVKDTPSSLTSMSRASTELTTPGTPSMGAGATTPSESESKVHAAHSGSEPIATTPPRTLSEQPTEPRTSSSDRLPESEVETLVGTTASRKSSRRSSRSPNGRRDTPLAQMLADHLSHMQAEKERPGSFKHHFKSHPDCPACKVSMDAIMGAGKGVGRIVEAGLKSPMDFTLGLARGFHNAPKLYGDHTVRSPDRVTGFQSGLKAAGKEFGFGFYDGISGLVTQPLKGAKEQGAAGFLKGLGKGMGGLILKPGAGYTFKGIYKELQKHFGSSVQNYTIAARTAQGYEEIQESTKEERSAIINRWHAIQPELAKAKMTIADDARNRAADFRAQRRGCLDERKRHAKEKHDKRKNSGMGKASQKDGATDVDMLGSDAKQFDEAIQASVAATSRGEPEEDRLIEKAIRASVAELLSARPTEAQGQRETSVADDAARVEEDLMDEQSTAKKVAPIGASDVDSMKGHSTAAGAVGRSEVHDTSREDEDLRKALEESKIAQEKRDREEERARREEDIVLEYMKKQSLAEEMHKRAAQNQ